MRLPEQRLWDTMRSNKPVGVQLDRIENVVGVGIPDVHYRSFKRETWIELKAPKAPLRASTRVLGDDGLNASQINWHLQSAGFGLVTFVLIRDDTKRLWLIEGRYADTMNEFTAAELTDFCSAKDTWCVIFDVLKRH